MTPLTSRKAAPRNQSRDFFRVLCQRNLYRLAKDVLGYKDMTDSFHKPLLLWSQVDPARKKLHMVPRGHFKTSGLTVAKNIQRILNDPNVRILIASNKAQNAEAMLAELKGHLAGNDKLLWAFPEILVRDPEKNAERWTTGSITVKRARKSKESTIETNGVEGELTSKHYEVGCFDDLVGLENSQSREERQKVITWIQAAQSLVDQPSRDLAWQDYVGTPWDFSDAYAWMLEKQAKGEWSMGVYIKPAWLPDPSGDEVPGYGRVRSSFPERFTIPVLMDLRKEIGSMRFSSQYLLKPTDAETAVFKRVEPNDRDGNKWGIPAIKPRSECPAIQDLWLAITIDPAIAQKKRSDYTAITVCGWDHQNNQHVLWLRWGRWTETQLIAQTYLAYNHFAARGNVPAVVAIEPIGFQQLYRNLFVIEGEKRGHILPVTKLQRDKGIERKNSRIQVLEPAWNAGELILYNDLDALNDLLDMAARFRTEGELDHDDLLDVLADNHQVRIRPHAPETDASRAFAALPPEVADELRFLDGVREERTRAGQKPLDRLSARMAWSAHRTFQEREESRQHAVLMEDY